MSKLTVEVLNELRLSIFNEEMDSKNILVIYPGRFQPFHINHMHSYDWLVTQFGKENVYIATSNSTDKDRSPFTFEEKKRIIEQYGIKNIIQVKSPYRAADAFKALGDKYDPKTTTLIYSIGPKDQTRLGKRAIRFNKTTYIPVKDLANPYVYYTIHPNSKFSLDGFGIISGTSTREALSDDKISSAELKERFKTIFGWFDSSIFNLVLSKLNPNKIPLKEGLNQWVSVIKNMSREQFKMLADAIKREYKQTVGLKPIIKKWMNRQPITDAENKIFKKQMVDIMKMCGLGAIAVAPIPASTLLIPILINVGKRFNIDVLPVDTPSPVPEHAIADKEFWSEVFTNLDEETDLLSEGGAAGHMTHIFEDNDLTFKDIRNIFELGLSGRISVENSATEKTDGQNLLFTFRGNNLYAARNSSDIKKGGETVQNMTARFDSRGSLQDAFSYAMMDLQDACRKLSSGQKELIFKGGACWMNCEVLYPSHPNVINYDGAYLMFHGAVEYNAKGEVVAHHPEFERILAGMIKQVNAHSQKVFSIRGQFRPKIEQSKDFSDKLDYFNRRLTYLRDITGSKDTDTLGTWHRRWWTDYIKKNVETKFGTLDPIVFNGLLDRWAFGKKSFLVNLKTIPNKDLYLWVKDFEATKLSSIWSRNNRLFESIILKFSAEVLSNVKTFVTANPDKAVEGIRRELDVAINKLKNSTNPKDIEVLKTQLKRIQAAGGLNKIVPTEGLVFRYKGKTYKITGLFAPINQLLGYFKYS